MRLSVALLFAYPTVASLAQHLLDRMALPAPSAPPPPSAPADNRASGDGAAPETQLSREEIFALLDESLNRVNDRRDEIPGSERP